MKLLLLGLIVLVVAGCSSNSSSPSSSPVVSQPSSVTREPAITYDPSAGDQKPEAWIKKTRVGKAGLWFKVNEDGTWHVDWDAERRPFDLIVIHHSATGPETKAESIDEGQRQRLYAGLYKSTNDDPFVQGLEPHSGHVVGGKERFIGYHHLVYADGTVTTELQPLIKKDDTWYVDMVGWHCGNWEANCRSLGICLVGDFTDHEPPTKQIEAAKSLIAHYKTLMPNLQVKPHHAFVATECPGKTWDSWGKRLSE